MAAPIDNSPRPIWLNSILFYRPFINFIMVLLGMTAAYYTTINSIKIELADKAETAIVEKIDRRLGQLEVLIVEGGVKKDDFHHFCTDIEARLAQIEFYMSTQGR